jgi:tagaturonate reductase
MKISIDNLQFVSAAVHSKPKASYFSLPEKVLQFGTGVLLRGLPDYYIDKANKQGIFNGRIVVIKSTGGDTDEFAAQDNLYTHCIKGFRGDELAEEYILNASVSRVLSAKQHWQEILNCASNPELQIVISNTTEVGLVLVENDTITHGVPVSFPGKLLAFLFERYSVFSGDANKGLVIIPTELVTGNGDKLLAMVQQLALNNNLSEAFIEWLGTANNFCNSLVDRIVPGKLPAGEVAATQTLLGYEDDLLIMSEVYSLWAIESSSEKVKDVLSFSHTDSTVVITADIEGFKELKLRLLNGTHTFCSGLAFLAGFKIVKNAMTDPVFNTYINALCLREIAPGVVGSRISASQAEAFGKNVLERFSNPFINHQWISITLNYSQKMRNRNVPLIIKHYEKNKTVPQAMALGFAAYLFFMKTELADNGKYYGTLHGESYLVSDEAAPYFTNLWKNYPASSIPAIVLANTELWETDMSALPGFEDAVRVFLQQIVEHGALWCLHKWNETLR